MLIALCAEKGVRLCARFGYVAACEVEWTGTRMSLTNERRRWYSMYLVVDQMTMKRNGISYCAK